MQVLALLQHKSRLINLKERNQNHPLENSLLKEIKATGITEEQAIRALTIAGKFAITKLPILEGTINSYLKEEFKYVDVELMEKIREQQPLSLVGLT